MLVPLSKQVTSKYKILVYWPHILFIRSLIADLPIHQDLFRYIFSTSLIVEIFEKIPEKSKEIERKTLNISQRTGTKTVTCCRQTNKNSKMRTSLFNSRKGRARSLNKKLKIIIIIINQGEKKEIELNRKKYIFKLENQNLNRIIYTLKMCSFLKIKNNST